MDVAAVRKAFDEQIRQRQGPSDPLAQVERSDCIVRSVSVGDGWNGVDWSDLRPETADEVIGEQIVRFASTGRPWEWKYYSYDPPDDLPQRLISAGFTPGPVEALMMAEIAELDLEVPPPTAVNLQAVVDETNVDALVGVHDQVFGGDHSGLRNQLLSGLATQPCEVAAVLAVAEGKPIAASRVEFHEGTEFASLWGGGTLRDWRGRGVFRSMVSYRAALASNRGFRYLQVDALPASRPILLRLGFVQLATTTPFVFNGRDN